MIVFSAVDTASRASAFDWHRSFPDSDGAIFKRDEDDFKRIAEFGHLWCARDKSDNYVAMAYGELEPRSHWEVGGLMVRARRRAGIGGVIARLTLGNVLFFEDPLLDDLPVIAHVIRGNRKPKGILESILRFVEVGEICESADKWPGLKSENGFVYGTTYRLDVPTTLLALADWCRTPPNDLDEMEVEIVLPEGVTLEHWEAAFRAMAVRSRNGGS